MEKRREPMNYEKALRIFRLKNGFTSSELRNAYKDLARKYHPDNHMKSSEEERLEAQEYMKEINEAYDFLSSGNNQSKNDIFSSFLDLLSFDTECEDSKYLNTIKEEFLFEFDQILNNGGREQDFRALYVRKLEKLRKSYYQWYYIDEADVKEELDYRLSLGEFYHSLVDIRKKYSKLDEVLEQINNKVKKYEEDALYNSVLPHIDRVRTICIENMRNSKWKNIDYFINLMDTRIGAIFAEFNKMVGFYDGFKQLFGADIFDDVANNHENPFLLDRKYRLSKRERYLIYDLNLALNNPSLYKYIPDVLEDASSYFAAKNVIEEGQKCI